MGYYKTNKGYLSEEYDDVSESPREMDHNSTFFTFSKSRRSPDKNEYKNMREFLLAYGAVEADNQYSQGCIAAGNDAMIKTFDKKGYIILPVYIYSHSGSCYKAAIRNPFSCDWDSSLIGVIFIKKSDIIEEFKVKKISSKLKKDIIERLQAEVDLYSDYADGECYFYQLLDAKGEELESCGGFIGNLDKNGAADCLGFKDVVYIGETIDYEKESNERIDELLKRVKELSGEIVEPEIDVDDENVSIMNYVAAQECAFHLEDFCSKDLIDMEILEARLDKEDMYYVI